MTNAFAASQASSKGTQRHKKRRRRVGRARAASEGRSTGMQPEPAALPSIAPHFIRVLAPRYRHIVPVDVRAPLMSVRTLFSDPARSDQWRTRLCLTRCSCRA